MVSSTRFNDLANELQTLSQTKPVTDRSMLIFEIQDLSNCDEIANILSRYGYPFDMRNAASNALNQRPFIFISGDQIRLGSKNDYQKIEKQFHNLKTLPKNNSNISTKQQNFAPVSVTVFDKYQNISSIQCQNLFTPNNQSSSNTNILYTPISESRLIVNNLDNKDDRFIVDYSNDSLKKQKISNVLNTSDSQSETLLFFELENGDILVLTSDHLDVTSHANDEGDASHTLLFDKNLEFKKDLGGDKFIRTLTATLRTNCHNQPTLITSNQTEAHVWDIDHDGIKPLWKSIDNVYENNLGQPLAPFHYAIGPTGTVAVSSRAGLFVFNPEANIVLGCIKSEYFYDEVMHHRMIHNNDLFKPNLLFMNAYGHVIYTALSPEEKGDTIELYKLNKKKLNNIDKSLQRTKRHAFKLIIRTVQLSDNRFILHVISQKKAQEILLYAQDLSCYKKLVLKGAFQLKDGDCMCDAVRYPDDTIVISVGKIQSGNVTDFMIHAFKPSMSGYEHIVSFEGIGHQLNITPQTMSLLNYGSNGATEFNLGGFLDINTKSNSSIDKNVFDDDDNSTFFKKETYNILSVDGGGAKGIMPAFALSRLYGSDSDGSDSDGSDDDNLHKIRSDVHHFAGTSVGGIIAGGLATNQFAKVNEIVDMFEKNSQDIFPAWRRCSMGLFMPKYLSDPLEKMLTNKFEKKLLSNLNHEVSITAFNKTRKSFKLFTRSDARQNVIYDARLTDIMMATSAAPSFLPAKEIAGEVYVDGGMAINRPDMQAYLHALRLGIPPEIIRVVSLGTGESIYTGNELSFFNNSILSWKKALISVPMSEAEMINARFMSQQLGNRYLRIEIPLKEDIAMDNSSSENIKKMKKSVKGFFKENKHVVEQYEKVFDLK